MHRLAVLALLAGGLLLLARRAPATGDDRRATILFDSLSVGPTVFSPNGDGVRDSVKVRFKLLEPATVLVFVTPAGSPDTVRVLVTSRQVAANESLQDLWFGKDQAGDTQPDGLYTIHFVASTASGPLENQRQVRLDRSPPVPQILAVEPRRYVPSQPGAVPRIRVRVTRSMVEDRLGVAVLDPQGVSRDTLNPEGGFAGDGDYLFVCENCSFLDDGFERLHAFGRDVAGNDSTVVDSLDVNVQGPALTVRHPPLPRSQQQADSLVGEALDRQAVVAVTAVIGTAPDTIAIALPPRDGAPSPTYRWFLDVSTLLAAEGAHPILLRAIDVDSVRADLQVTVTVDRTSPPPPVLDPPLPAVSKSPLLMGAVLVDTEQTSRLVVSGGTQPPDTMVVTPSRPRLTYSRSLAMGANQLSFRCLDRAGNASVPVTGSVVWDSSPGLVAPERFSAGSAIEVSVGATPAQAVFVRILALDGSLVRTFADNTAKLHYQFPWDLRTPEGHEVMNGAYLVQAQVRHASGTEERHRIMIAVVR